MSLKILAPKVSTASTVCCFNLKGRKAVTSKADINPLIFVVETVNNTIQTMSEPVLIKPKFGIGSHTGSYLMVVVGISDSVSSSSSII